MAAILSRGRWVKIMENQESEMEGNDSCYSVEYMFCFVVVSLWSIIHIPRVTSLARQQSYGFHKAAQASMTTFK